MKSKISNLAQNWWGLLLPFFSSLILLRLSPMMYDGWSGDVYYYYNGGIVNWLRYICGPYRNSINGRISSNIVCGFIESIKSEWLIDAVGAIILTAIVIFAIKIFDVKKKSLSILTYTMLILLMPYKIRVYVVQIALLQYVTPVLFVFLALYFMQEYWKNKTYKLFVLLCMLTFIACSWMENSSLSYGIILFLLFCVDFYKFKRVDWKLVIVIAIGAISGILMLSAPGLRANRIADTGAKATLLSIENIYSHVNSIFLSFIYSGSLENVIISLLFLGTSCKAFFDKRKGKRWRLLCIINGIFLFFFFGIGLRTQEFNYTANIDMGLYQRLAAISEYIIPTLVVIYSVWICANLVILLRRTLNCILLIIYSILCIVSILTTNQVGERIYSPALIVVLVLVSCAIGKTYEEERLHLFARIGIVLMCFLAVDYEIQLWQRLYYVNQERQEKIDWIREAQFLCAEEKTYYVLPSYCPRDAYLKGETTPGTFHYPQFLHRYGLDEETLICFSDMMPSEYLYTSLNENALSAVVLESKTGKYNYNYYVYFRKDAEEEYELLKSGLAGMEKWTISLNNGAGIYTVVVVKHDLTTGEEHTIGQVTEYEIE